MWSRDSLTISNKVILSVSQSPSALFSHREPHTTEVACFLMRLPPQAALGSRSHSPGSPPGSLAAASSECPRHRPGISRKDCLCLSRFLHFFQQLPEIRIYTGGPALHCRDFCRQCRPLRLRNGFYVFPDKISCSDIVRRRQVAVVFSPVRKYCQ